MREATVDTRTKTRSADLFGSALEGGIDVRPQPGASGSALVYRGRAGTLRLPQGQGPESVMRLVIPVPATGLDEAGLGRLLWEVTGATDRALLLVAKVGSVNSEMQVRRRLTTLAALLRRRRDDFIETVVVHERSWVEALRRVCGPGDAVVLPGDSPAQDGLRPAETLAQRLFRELQVGVYLADGLPRDLLDAPRGKSGSVLAWAAPLLVLVAFGGIQSEIVVQTQAWFQTILLAATVGLELAALLVVQPLVSSWR